LSVFTIFTISGLLCRGLIGISPNVSVLLAGTEKFGEIPIRPRHNSPEIVNIVNTEIMPTYLPLKSRVSQPKRR